MPGSDWTQAANQDHLTANIWLTRKTTKGLFNAASEGGYAFNSSPADTEWAFGLLAGYASLTYANWQTWAVNNPPATVGRDAVLHLITDDIYLGIKFTAWGGNGGGFTYERTTATAVPEPPGGMLGIVGALFWLATARRKIIRS